MYTDFIVYSENFDTEEGLRNLLKIAEELELQNFNKIFFSQFGNNIKTKNAMTMWKFALEWRSDEGLKVCGDFILDHLDECKGELENVIESDKETAAQLFVFFSGVNGDKKIKKQLLDVLKN